MRSRRGRHHLGSLHEYHHIQRSMTTNMTSQNRAVKRTRPTSMVAV